MKEIVLPYQPRDCFVPFHERGERWSVIIAHRRAGKTVACLMDMLDHALRAKLPNSRYAYISPFFVQSKSVAWDYLKAFAKPVMLSVNESELRVDLINGSRISLYGGDNGERLRGLALDGVILDEYADMPPNLWNAVVRPALADRKGWGVFIGTVKGRNQLWNLYAGAQSDPEWYSNVLRASETGIIPEDELEDVKRTTTPEAFAAEFECDPSAAILGAYFGKDIAEAERAGRITNVSYDDALPVHTSWDLGIGDSTAIWFFQVVGHEIRIIDHYEANGHAIPHYVSELASRGYRYGNDYVPHDARVRSLETGRTRIETLQNLGRKPCLVPSHKIMDGINAARLTIPRCWFDAEKCRSALEALRQYRSDFDEKTRAFKDTPRHDWSSHTADAFRYLAMAYRELSPEPSGPAKPILKSMNEITYDELMSFEPKARRERV